MNSFKYPIVLSIAGSDSGGGAGIQADLKTISAMGCFATTAITAITVQNTLGVSAIHPIPVEVVKAQIRAVMDDLRPSTIKIGMIHSAELAMGIAETLSGYPTIPIIIDPVMVATSGDRLITADTVDTLTHYLFPLAELVTPNLDEAAILANMKVETVEDMRNAAVKIIGYGCTSVLVKGGHLKGPDLFDVYLNEGGTESTFRSKIIRSMNTHGTGCTLSSAIAAFLALGNNMETSISNGITYVQQAITDGSDVKTGNGDGPLNHFFEPKKLIKIKMD